MKIPSIEQIRDCDTYTIENEPIASIDLMERAAQKCFEILSKHLTGNEKIGIVCGMGNNGGDGLALARMLAQRGYICQVAIVQHAQHYSPDCQTNLARLQNLEKNKTQITFFDNPKSILNFENCGIIIDAILGSGLNKLIDNQILISVITQINSIADKCSKKVISIDIPTGLFAQQPMPENAIAVKADYTITFQFPKLSFFTENAYPYVGEWTVADIGLSKEFIQKIETPYYLTEDKTIENENITVSKFAHKGTFGHGLLIAGSKSMLGAAILSAKAALRGGIGRLTVHIPQVGYTVMQTAVPEAMCLTDSNENVFTSVDFKALSAYNVIAIGPGLGKNAATAQGIKKLIGDYGNPIIFDADAINLLAENKTWLEFLPPDCIFTPHIKEFERLVGDCKNWQESMEKQRNFSTRHRCIVVLKGAYTRISSPYGGFYFNNTGNPGLATPGSGDVLTGIILALKARGFTSLYAAIKGVWLHGKAADFALQKQSMESIIASDIIDYLRFVKKR
ncbi:MAG: NAD(P)H-hydrate dehydratase [Bacteroidales bacterium]|jgi:NAD(P)H-hydrate epimerase|nr:NAD(P)H-hydrate dehydratase [Bacteroidales bacterium]